LLLHQIEPLHVARSCNCMNRWRNNTNNRTSQLFINHGLGLSDLSIELQYGTGDLKYKWLFFIEQNLYRTRFSPSAKAASVIYNHVVCGVIFLLIWQRRTRGQVTH